MIFNDTSETTNFENYIPHTKEGIPGIQSHRLEIQKQFPSFFVF
mgnify:CR=1 FL=1